MATSTAESFERYKSAEEEFKRLEETYRDVRFGMLHGKMSSEEKNAALDAFSAGETQVLVATSVVEVGVDVPNASVIIIEDADRHGVSTLHQLRGRVGRGHRQSACFLLVGAEATRADHRLRVLEKTNNGFHVAESDLRLRGAGDLLGTRQSGGTLDLFHASVQTDLYLLEAARTRAAAETIARAACAARPPGAARHRAARQTSAARPKRVRRRFCEEVVRSKVMMTDDTRTIRACIDRDDVRT